jgi:hypothetical protein
MVTCYADKAAHKFVRLLNLPAHLFVGIISATLQENLELKYAILERKTASKFG